MFNSALIYELAVLKQYAEPLLFEIDKDCKEYTEAKRLLKFLDYFLPVPSEDLGRNSISHVPPDRYPKLAAFPAPLLVKSQKGAYLKNPA